ncbi:MAG: hypothetical protein ACOYYS_00255 [Chloroflexota bacterium]
MQFSLARADPDMPQAGAPGLVNYQGYLVGDGNTPLHGLYSLRLGIYAAASGGNPLWYDDFGSVRVTEGYFNVVMGSQKALDIGAFNGPITWLQVTIVNGSTETHLPRQQFAAVPYALQAQYAASVPWSGITGDAVALGCRVYQSESVAVIDLSSMPAPGHTISWSNEIADTANCWTSGEKLVVPASGYYTAGANVGFSVGTADDGKRVNLALARYNSSGVLQEYLSNQTIFAKTGTINYLNTNVSMFHAAAGDYLVATVGGNATGTLTLIAVGTPVPPAVIPVHPHFQSAWLARIP